MDHNDQPITGDPLTVVRNYFHAGALKKLPKNTRLLDLDDPIRSIYYIGSGYLRIYSINSRGEQYTHIIYGPGEIVPLSWLSKQMLTNSIYETMTDSILYAVPLETFDADLQRNSTLAYGMLLQTARQYRIYTMRVDNLEYKYASERLAYRLILLANRFGEHSGKSVTIIPPMTHQLLGTSLNLSRESVSREMEKLVKKGLIRYGVNRQIIITDITALSEQSKVPLYQGLSPDTQTHPTKNA